MLSLYTPPTVERGPVECHCETCECEGSIVSVALPGSMLGSNKISATTSPNDFWEYRTEAGTGYLGAEVRDYAYALLAMVGE
jgi:hypothetical protein